MARNRPKIEWDVPRDQRTAPQRRGQKRSGKKIEWEARPVDRQDSRPKRGRQKARWDNEAVRVASKGETKRLPSYRETRGLTHELAEALVPGRMLVLTKAVQPADQWEGADWPVPLATEHHPREWDDEYDPAKETLLPKGGMVVYAGQETINARAGNHRNVRMDVHKFLIRDGIYVLTDLHLVELPS